MYELYLNPCRYCMYTVCGGGKGVFAVSFSSLTIQIVTLTSLRHHTTGFHIHVIRQTTVSPLCFSNLLKGSTFERFSYTDSSSECNLRYLKYNKHLFSSLNFEIMHKICNFRFCKMYFFLHIHKLDFKKNVLFTCSHVQMLSC